ncbi:hypothetical protein Rhe02_24150 [Rhizocola hellebori]|uniref:Putative restriction endonuclease domain-containing protein n=1 Tax=Rhizocola hellebori TaxID=1392758 RepID=A0A8J3VFZ5_9ACTN|nr:Uma2 family endonuclease [Rhizocola hellebori]GIH04348.1 hypothetical protein Rhe02_24150 [Rhizocola hellebori]
MAVRRMCDLVVLPKGDAPMARVRDIVDAMTALSHGAPQRHRRIARLLANALEAAAGNQWYAAIGCVLRLQDDPLCDRRPDVFIYRAETIDISPTRPEHVLMVIEVISPGSETTDREIKLDQYAQAGIQFYWRVEQAMTDVPIIYTYSLDMASDAYRDTEIFSGVVNMTVPFPATIDLATI